MAEIDRYTPLDQLPELLRAEEVAAWYGCGKGTVYEMVRKGELASVRLGRLLRIKRDGLTAALTNGAAR